MKVSLARTRSLFPSLSLTRPRKLTHVGASAIRRLGRPLASSNGIKFQARTLSSLREAAHDYSHSKICSHTHLFHKLARLIRNDNSRGVFLLECILPSSSTPGRTFAVRIIVQLVMLLVAMMVVDGDDVCHLPQAQFGRESARSTLNTGCNVVPSIRVRARFPVCVSSRQRGTTLECIQRVEYKGF